MDIYKKFLFRIFLFFLPFEVPIIIALSIIIVSKEYYYNIDKVIMSKEKYLVGYAYSDNITRYLKYKTITENNKYNIIAIGSSRVLQFREEMFRKNFYNAGYTVSSISDFEVFIRTIPKEKYPDYIIIGLDQWMFNEAVNDLKTKKKPSYWTRNPTTINRPKLEHCNNILRDIYNRKITFSNLQTKHDYLTIGLNALINTDGFRTDGSRASGLFIPKLLKGDTALMASNLKEIKKRIENQDWPLQYADKINLNAVSVLDTFLFFCTKNKIQVIGFIPPFADWTQKRLIDSGKYGYLTQIDSAVKPVFEKYKFNYYFYPSAKYCDSNDSEMLDGSHGGEMMHVRILIKMLKSGSVLNNVCDVNQLEKDLNNAKNRYVIYDY